MAAGRNHGFWMRRALDGLAGVAEALYPDNDLGAPDWRDTDMVERAAEWWLELPAPTRHLMILLFGFVELSAPVLAPGLGRFSRLPVQRRLDAVRRWRDSPLRPFQLLGDSLKSATTMLYLSHPDALDYIGFHKACERDL